MRAIAFVQPSVAAPASALATARSPGSRGPDDRYRAIGCQPETLGGSESAVETTEIS